MDKAAPYTPAPASIPRFLTTIQSTGVPPKVTHVYLKSIGFKSSNDRYLLTIFKTLGFLDNNGVPTDRWKSYRNKSQSKAIMAQAIAHAYPGLFRTYTDAYRKDNEALRNFFSTHSSSLSDTTLQYVVRTFKTLCEAANFETDAATPVPAEATSVADVSVPEPAPAVTSVRTVVAAATAVPAININIELHLPATDDASIYEKLFAALHKHVLAPRS